MDIQKVIRMKSELFLSGYDYSFYFLPREDSRSSVEFISYRIEGRSNGDKRLIFAKDELEFKPLYMKVTAVSNDRDDLTEDIEEAEKFITGTIKFDHCCHLNFPSYIHYCSMEEAKDLGKLLEDVYKEAGRFVDYC